MKKTIITLSALFMIASLTVTAQDDKKKKEPATEQTQLNGAKTTEAKPADAKPTGGTRMAISTKGAPATKSSGTNSKTKSAPAATISPNTNADGTPKTN